MGGRRRRGQSTLTEGPLGRRDDTCQHDRHVTGSSDRILYLIRIWIEKKLNGTVFETVLLPYGNRLSGVSGVHPDVTGVLLLRPLQIWAPK